MPARTPLLRPLGALVALGLTLGLAACSDEAAPGAGSSSEAGSAVEPDASPETSTEAPAGGDVAAFCTDATAVVDGTMFEGVAMEDLLGDEAVLDLAIERMDAVEAPAEIAEDWTLLSDATRTLFDGLAAIDPASATVDQDQADLLAELDSTELDAAAENVEAYIEDSCDPVE